MSHVRYMSYISYMSYKRYMSYLSYVSYVGDMCYETLYEIVYETIEMAWN